MIKRDRSVWNRVRAVRFMALFAALAALQLAFTASASAGKIQCGWFAVLSCSTSQQVAGQFSDTVAAGQVIQTDDFRGFKRGYFCVVNGPMKKAEAKSYLKRIPQVKDGYAKRACGDFDRYFD